MEIETTTFEITSESAGAVERGSILELEITVHREITYASGQYDHTYFNVTFNRDSDVKALRWTKTVDRDGSGGMSDSHVIATHEAADHVCRALRAC